MKCDNLILEQYYKHAFRIYLKKLWKIVDFTLLNRPLEHYKLLLKKTFCVIPYRKVWSSFKMLHLHIAKLKNNSFTPIEKILNGLLPQYSVLTYKKYSSQYFVLTYWQEMKNYVKLFKKIIFPKCLFLLIVFIDIITSAITCTQFA